MNFKSTENTAEGMKRSCIKQARQVTDEISRLNSNDIKHDEGLGISK